MDRFVKRYMVPKTDQYGNVVYKDGEKVMVQSMISRKNPESEEARDEMKEQSAREYLVEHEKKRKAKAEAIRKVIEVQEGRGGAGGKLLINLRRKETLVVHDDSKCCCGGSDSFHENMLHLEMDHTCNECKRRCYGMCTMDYICNKCKPFRM